MKTPKTYINSIQKRHAPEVEDTYEKKVFTFSPYLLYNKTEKRKR